MTAVGPGCTGVNHEQDNPQLMTAYKVVVDGSNVATEGRTRPSLAQLDEAVRSFIEEHPSAEVLVIVDSSFPNRIDPADVAVFEEAFLAGEIITPPAGTVGRGDAFILKVADKLGATVFSNDSFQEFHGTYEWLFEKGRLIGGKPIPGLGWVFTPRVPVRGQKSREAVREAKRQTVRVGSPEAMRPMPVPKAPPPFLTKAHEDASRDTDEFGDRRRRKKRRSGRDDGRSSSGEVMFDESSVDRVNLDHDGEGAAGPAGNRSRKRRGRGRSRGDGEQVEVPALAINEPGVFLTFIATNLPGSFVDGVVDDYSSHGFYVTAGGARCYVPLSGLAEPTPRSAKEVVRRGETRNFIVKAFDALRRGIELALIGSPSAGGSSVAGPGVTASAPQKQPRGNKAVPTAVKAVSTSKRVASKKAPAKKAPAEIVPAESASARKAPPKKVAPTTAGLPVLRTTATKKASAAKRIAASQRAIGSSTVEATTSRPVTKAPATKSLAPVKARTPPVTPAAAKVPVNKAAVNKVAVKKVAVKKVAVKKVAVKKVAVKKAATKNVPVKKVAVKNVPVKKAAATRAPAKKAPAK